MLEAVGVRSRGPVLSSARREDLRVCEDLFVWGVKRLKLVPLMAVAHLLLSDTTEPARVGH